MKTKEKLLNQQPTVVLYGFHDENSWCKTVFSSFSNFIEIHSFNNSFKEYLLNTDKAIFVVFFVFDRTTGLFGLKIVRL